MKSLVCFVAVLLACQSADASCGRSSWHTLSSSRGWSHACYRCHRPASYSGYGLTADIMTIAKERNRYESQILARQQEYESAVQLIDKLGLNGDGSPRLHGLFRAYGYGSSSYGYTPHAEQGSTVYGYSQISQPYGNIDVAALYQQSSRLTQNAQTLAGQAHSDFTAAVREQGAAVRDVAEIQAIGQTAAAIVQSLKSDPATFSREFQFSVTQGNDGQVQVQPMAGAAVDPVKLLQDRCVSCHSGKEPKGGVDLTLWPNFSRDQRRAVFDAVTHADPAKRMPLGPGGQAGAPLELPEIESLMRAWVSTP